MELQLEEGSESSTIRIRVCKLSGGALQNDLAVKITKHLDDFDQIVLFDDTLARSNSICTEWGVLDSGILATFTEGEEIRGAVQIISPASCAPDWYSMYGGCEAHAIACGSCWGTDEQTFFKPNEMSPMIRTCLGFETTEEDGDVEEDFNEMVEIIEDDEESVCGDETCNLNEDPNSCGEDCNPSIENPHSLYYQNTLTSAEIGCENGVGWHYGNDTDTYRHHWVWASACPLPPTSNLFDYDAYNARWSVKIEKNGHYKIWMTFPSSSEVCDMNGVSPSIRPADDLVFGIMISGSSGTLKSNVDTTIGQDVVIWNDIYLTKGAHTIILYDIGSSGDACNTGTSTANRFVIAQEGRIEWLY